MDLKEEDILGNKIHTHWYYVSKGRAMRKFLGRIKAKEVLDVGAGSGVFAKQLLDHGICDSATCVDPGYLADREEDQNGKPIQFVRHVDIVPQSLLLMMDVLEHVPDDTALLKEYADKMPNGGNVLITVPAFGMLWSGHDIFLEHYRRYTARMVDDLVLRAGLKPVRTRYFFGLLFPVVAAIRLIKGKLLREGRAVAKSDLAVYSPALNASLVIAHDFERVALFPFNRLAGLSVFCLCQKV